MWAILLFADPMAVGATPVAALYGVFRSDVGLAAALGGAGMLAACALFAKLPWPIVLMIPQQSLLLISAFGAITAIVTGQYADGVERARGFIAADQVHIILAATSHAFAIIATTHDQVSEE